MILAVAWAAMYLSKMLSERGVSLKRLIGGIVFHGLGIAVSFLGAFGIVNLYNILKHSPANTISEFLIPLLSKNYMTGVLHLDFPLFPCGYMAEIVLFLIGTAAGISGWSWFSERKKDSGKEISWQIHLIFFLSISALGRLVYYINRPAYHNLDCCHLSAVILLAFLGQRCLGYLKRRQWKEFLDFSFASMINHIVSITCGIVLVALATGTVLQFSQNSYIKENYHNEEELDQFAQAVSMQIPPNTFAFGLNGAELYSWLHWSTQYFGIDFSDLAVVDNGAQRLMDTMKEQNVEQCLTTKSSLDILERSHPEVYQWFCDTYTVEKTFPIYSEEYLYYIKNE